MLLPIIPYNPKLKELAKHLRNNSTYGEIKLWKYLRKRKLLGYKFMRQKPIRYYIVDFYCPELLLAIEIDGNIHQGEQLVKDAKRQRYLENLGIKVIRFRERDVLGNIESVLYQLSEQMKGRFG